MTETTGATAATSPTPDAGDPPAFPMQRTCPFSPPPQYDGMRADGPVHPVRLPSGQQAWLVNRMDDIRALLTDPRFSSDRLAPDFPSVLPNRGQARLRPSLIAMDAPEHGPERRQVVGEFTVKRLRALTPRIQQIVDDRIDAMLAGPKPADLVRELALPVPSLVICELLGVPYADHDFFQARTSVMLKRTTPAPERTQAVDELQSYLHDLVTAKEAAPGDDLLGRQITKRRAQGDHDHDDLVALAFLLLVAGHETTANMISLGTVTLLEHPEALAALRDDPGKTLAAVEELLRYYTIAETAASRLVTEDVELGGHHFTAGDGVIGLSHAANHDPAVFPDPGTFDIERGGRHHVAFGFGPHQCLGQNLARQELQVVFDTLFRRIPTLRVAVPVDDLPFKHDSSLYGLYELPVTW